MWPIDEILKGNQNAGSRLIRGLEDRDPQAFEALQTLFPHSGKAFIIGITGAPGVGKSTLINCLISHLRQMDKKVGVLAVDPTSPFSGGAILGDRLLMQSHSTDENVFIRSMASRGSLGGLSRAVKDAAVILDAMGFDIIIIETVGAGQSEIDVSIMAHTVGIVTIPGTSDGIQAVKAGIMETGHVLIVNKADMLEADESVQRLKMVLEMQKPINSSWKPAIVKTSAKEDTGIA
ncbi:MAG: methylmalonyl Co-A mutase-associated GTPase MeaB, partial [Desulfobacteraceae bacterium]|nr:methylmalonyl Co-A mutase-associated GTPase MeaB [Desulfobacteraceae bacterium]